MEMRVGVCGWAGRLGGWEADEVITLATEAKCIRFWNRPTVRHNQTKLAQSASTDDPTLECAF